MESTVTLVNPTAVQLDFSKSNMRNSVLSIAGQPLYKISSPDRMQMKTEVRDVNTNELLFVIKQRDLLPDVVSFTNHDNGKSKNLKKWLKQSRDSEDKRAVYTFETESGSYEWKIDLVHRLVLYQTGDRASPLARMIQGATPSIFFEAGTEKFRDQALAAFLVIEREMRGGEAVSKAMITDADGQNAIQIGAALH